MLRCMPFRNAGDYPISTVSDEKIFYSALATSWNPRKISPFLAISNYWETLKLRGWSGRCQVG
ncbi:unnamed protein product [Acanthoscelides obtectus]|uniref:Uncharacterized protein n=1 Tax=Acanthoscelides obtectus TaxID=200917 RepID=A0A9P0JUH1_ACAOB|nr:unnamed protein product [Acanthoscelides obtectus]CAK1665996.1 hypothetical protein AOBTE_LOCUS25105 [Acanthoscelides obtectus]